VTGVSLQRWQEAQEAERGFWSTKGFGLDAFRGTVGGSMRTAAWAQPHLQLPTGDWLDVGVGPLGVGCTHFLERGGELHALDPIEPTPADQWQLPEPCRALVRFCHGTTVTHVGRAEQLDFGDDRFAFVALENMLDHVQDPGAALREARRVLKPGGKLLVAIDTFSWLGEARYHLITRRKQPNTILVRAHPHRFSANDVMQIVAAAGFRIAHANTPDRMTAIAGRGHRMRLLAG